MATLARCLLIALWCYWLPAADTVQHPFRGVTCIERVETAPRPLRMHVAKIDLAAPGIAFKLSPPGGKLETVRQTTLDFLLQEHAQIAINAHYFLPWPSSSPEASLVGFAACTIGFASFIDTSTVFPTAAEHSIHIMEIYVGVLIGAVTFVSLQAPRGTAATAQGLFSAVTGSLAAILGSGVGGLIAGLWLGFVLPPTQVQTLASAWQAPRGVRSPAQTLALRVIGVGALVAVVVGIVAYGTVTWQGNPLYQQYWAQPAAAPAGQVAPVGPATAPAIVLVDAR